MSNIKGLPKQIPVKDIPFKAESTGVISKHKYEGDFVVRVPNTRDRSRIGIEIAKLNGGVRFEDLDDNTALLHNAVAFLTVLLVDAPDWFVLPEDEGGMFYGLDTLDSNVAVDVFLQANAKVNEWQDALTGEKSEKRGRKTAN